jgi:5-methylcytosine-specific restriction endonuclease McrA
MTDSDEEKLNKIVAEACAARDQREQSYRAQALKMYPHICGRCGREFSGKNLRELTVHHRDHNHDNNPSDGSNWELLCLYCHDNEHQRQLEAEQGARSNRDKPAASTYNPFADLKSMLDKDKE